jgi:hypothetical protein
MIECLVFNKRTKTRDYLRPGMRYRSESANGRRCSTLLASVSEGSRNFNLLTLSHDCLLRRGSREMEHMKALGNMAAIYIVVLRLLLQPCTARRCVVELMNKKSTSLQFCS